MVEIDALLRFPKETFPITVELFDAETDQLVWQCVLEGGDIFKAPTEKELGMNLYSVLTMATGWVAKTNSDGSGILYDQFGTVMAWDENQGQYVLQE